MADALAYFSVAHADTFRLSQAQTAVADSFAGLAEEGVGLLQGEKGGRHVRGFQYLQAASLLSCRA